MEKKFILVGMESMRSANEFMREVINHLIERGVDHIDADHCTNRFETLNTRVWFVWPNCERYMDGIRADALFGTEAYRIPLRERAKPEAENPLKHGLGLVDYICLLENKPWGINGLTKKMYVTMPPRNGKSLYRHILNATYGKSPEYNPNFQLELYAALMKGENNMNNVMNDIVFGKPAYLVTESGRVPVKIDNCTMSTLEPANFEGHVLTPAEDYICRDAYTMHELAKKFISAYERKPRTNEIPAIKNVIFSGPCTIVLWEDGTKTVVRCNNDVLDPEKGLAMAIAKKAMGTNKSGSNYYDIFKKWLPKAEEEENDG